MVSTPKISETRWITDGAWVTGLVGCLSVVAIALICQRYRWLDSGLTIFDLVTVTSKLDVQLFCLIISALMMCLTELIRLALASPSRFFNIAPALRHGKYLEVIISSLWRYLCYLLIFFMLIEFYKTAGEYGFKKQAHYYQAWFRMCDWLYMAFIWGGFPYVLLTYAFKYDDKKENNSYHRLIECLIIFILRKINIFKFEYPVDQLRLKKIATGLLVRVFFVPLMTVFFTHQFPRFVQNIGYIIDWLPQKISNESYGHATFNRDFVNILKPVIFTIDVTLAWCGYVLTSRWLDNETQSAEPTLLGWAVCLISYPPFQLTALYFYFPSETLILSQDNQYFISFFSILMILSLMVYTSATIVFGVRFSNLTHRGIIRTGPYAIVRHPAYASKNISWWLGIFPALLYLFVSGRVTFTFFVLSTLGLMAQSFWYYLRAVTEERHLSIDPAYLEYCKQVKYRFVPRLF